MPDPFAGHANGTSASALASFPIVPSDTVDLPSVVRLVYVATAGTIRWQGRDGAINTTNEVAGPVPIRAVRIFATGTTATGMTGFV